jgi:hypothetical protein
LLLNFFFSKLVYLFKWFFNSYFNYFTLSSKNSHFLDTNVKFKNSKSFFSCKDSAALYGLYGTDFRKGGSTTSAGILGLYDPKNRTVPISSNLSYIDIVKLRFK